MKTSLNLLGYLLLLGTITSLTACNDENFRPLLSNDETTELVSDETDIDGNYDEVDDLALAALENDFDSGGRVERDGRFDCANLSIQITGDTRTITVDFGDGCEGPQGHVRSGIIIITATGNHWEPGATHVAELVDFYIDDVKIEGIRTVTNISESQESNPTFSIQLEEGKITWPDDTYAIREVNRVRTLYRGENPLGDEVHLEGNVNGVNREGVNYAAEIIEALVFTRSCRESRRGMVPVSGVKNITIGDQLTTIDYGDGECDNLVAVTRNGETVEVVLKFRRR